MLCSLFTPCHDPRHIAETYSSLNFQSNVTWEWVVVPNGIARHALPEQILQDERVRVIDYPESAPRNIGALKRFACEHSRGDLLLELDHDDLLFPGALQSAAAAVQNGAGFVYSDVAVFTDHDLKEIHYGARYGWENYPVTVYGTPLRATRNFDLSARTLCEVHYAPDHFRCWSTDAYWKAGGHNPDLLVADDHELLCKTYLTGAPFHYTGTCEYLYRSHAKNSVKTHNKAIQELQARNREKYTRDLAFEWADREGLPTGNLVDWMRECDWRPTDPLPIDEQFGVIEAAAFLEFMPWAQVKKLIQRLWDQLVPGGWLLLDLPHYESGEVRYNPNYMSFYNSSSLGDLFGEKWQKVQLTYHNGSPTRIPNLLRLDLTTLKGQRHPGIPWQPAPPLSE